EIRLIAEESARWEIETGGDLFGLWSASPTLHLATRAGPAAVRDAAHFRLDVEYLRTLSAVLGDEWGLEYFGDWHSHHRLRFTAPSSVVGVPVAEVLKTPFVTENGTQG